MNRSHICRGAIGLATDMKDRWLFLAGGRFHEEVVAQLAGIPVNMDLDINGQETR